MSSGNGTLKQRHYPMLQRKAYFESAATGAVPDYVYQGYQDYLNARYLDGGDSIWEGMGTFEMIDWSKGWMARMLGAEPEEIAFGENTSQVFSQFTAGLPLEAGDNVILTDTTFISMSYAWDLRRQNDGIEIRLAKSEQGMIPAEAVLRLADERTRVISLNHVESRTGYRHDLKTIGAFCRERGILLAVDAAQSAGVMAIDVKEMGIDFLAGNNYKWMQGLCGVGYGYFGPRTLERLRPTMAGWKSHGAGLDQDILTLEISRTASRFEYGYPNTPGIFALGKVAEKYMELGREAIEARVLQLVDRIRQGVEARAGLTFWSDYPPQNLSQIAIVTADDSYDLTTEGFRGAGVFTAVKDGRAYGGKHALRLGVHYYNDESDIDRLFEVIDRFHKGEKGWRANA